MALTGRSEALPAASRLALRSLALPMALLVVIALAVPMMRASHANLTSDESLYLAEAYSLAHGHGLTYPSGDAVTHRPPLYPLLLAPVVRLGGAAAAYRLTGAIVVMNAILVMLFAWRLAGGIAGAIAGFAAAGSAYLNGLGTTLYLDPLECTFMLLSLGALQEATRASPIRWFAVSGLMLGLAFLVKESAVQWAPLGVLAWLALPSLRNRMGARAALAFALTFVATVGGWWIWVWAKTGQLFMLGSPGLLNEALLAAAFLALGGFALAVARWPESSTRRLTQVAPLAAVMLVLTWGALMLFGLTHYATWPYSNDYAHSVPNYLNSVAPQVQPYLLLGAAWIGIAAVYGRGRGEGRLIALAALLFLPFGLFSANRALQLRDALPIVYLSYVALGVAGASVIGVVRRLVRQPIGDVLLSATLIVFGLTFVFQQVLAFQLKNDDAAAIGASVRADSWDNPFVRYTSGWLDANLPPGSHILSSRLYFSSLYVGTEGRFSIRQMPTVRVDVDGTRTGLLTPKSNLFRWGDETFRPGGADDRWLYLKQFPVKNYWVGLSQRELLGYIAAHDIDYVVLTGEDAAFSSLSYAGYFSGHPAFKLRYTEAYSPSDQLFVFDVDRSKLDLRPYSTAIAPTSAAALERETGMDVGQLSWVLGTPLRVTDSDLGLSARERWAAIAGLDLAGQ